MKLQLNTGKTLNFWYIPENNNIATGLSNGQSVMIGPVSLNLESIDSAVLLNLFLVATSSSQSTIELNQIRLRVLRNGNSAAPLIDRNYPFPSDRNLNYINLQFVDDQPLLDTPAKEPVKYTIILTVDFMDPLTSSFSLITANFSEIDTPMELPLETSES